MDKQIYALCQIKDGATITSQAVCYDLTECARFFEGLAIRFYGHSIVRHELVNGVHIYTA